MIFHTVLRESQVADGNGHVITPLLYYIYYIEQKVSSRSLFLSISTFILTSADKDKKTICTSLSFSIMVEKRRVYTLKSILMISLLRYLYCERP